MAFQIGIIGFGNMGEAIAAGLKEKDHSVRIGILEKMKEKREAAISRLGAVDFSTDIAGFFSFSDTVIIAIKPQDLDTLLELISPHVDASTRIISVLAGKTIATFKEKLNTECIARFMPNLAAKEGRAFTAVAFAGNIPGDFRKSCLQIASSIGTAMEFPEKLMSAVTGLSGSGIAYVFSFLHAMALGGTKAGIPYAASLDIALSLLEGAAAVLRKSGEHPVSLLSKVTSPAGTTIEGVTILEESGFSASLIRAVEAASRRAEELES